MFKHMLKPCVLETMIVQTPAWARNLHSYQSSLGESRGPWFGNHRIS